MRCTQCHRMFGSLSAFDHHHTHVGRQVLCSTDGMHQDSRGRWRVTPKEGDDRWLEKRSNGSTPR